MRTHPEPFAGATHIVCQHEFVKCIEMRNFDNNDGDDNGDRCHDDLMECLLRIYCAWPLELSALAQKKHSTRK